MAGNKTPRAADTPRGRTMARPGTRASKARMDAKPAHHEPERTVTDSVASVARTGVHVTRRLVIFLVIIVFLFFSYANSLRIYWRQHSEIAATAAQIQASNDAITSLEDEIARWQDPAYVRAQARERLGWVVPGEIGFKVVDANGQVLGGGSEIDRVGTLPPGEHHKIWWEGLWGSVKAADNPEPVK